MIPSGIKICILNNSSSKESRAALGKFCGQFKQIKIFDSKKNLGVSAGRNYLVKHTKEELIFFIDNDAKIKTKNWPEKFSNQFEKNKEFDCFLFNVFEKQQNVFAEYPQFDIIGNKIVETKQNKQQTNKLSGCCSIIKRNAFERLGLFDEKMFASLEDFEFSIRAIVQGAPLKAKIMQDMIAIHDHKKAKKEQDKNAIKVRYGNKQILDSARRIEEKYRLSFKGNFSDWAEKTKKEMIENKTQKKNNAQLNAAKAVLMAAAREIALPIYPFAPKFIKKILKKKSWLATTPSCASLYLSSECNFKCKGCRRSIKEKPTTKEMTIETIKKALEKYPSIDSFVIAGFGEPTLCKDFKKTVGFLIEQKKFVGIITNGTNPTPLLSLEKKPDYVSISLHGYNKKSYLNDAGIDAFEKIIETFSKLKQKKFKTGFSFVLNKENYKQLKEIISLCDKLKPDFLHLTNYLPYDCNSKKEIEKIITKKDAKVIDFIEQSCKGKKYITIKPIYPEFEKPAFNCHCYYHLINLDGEGNIGGCERQAPPTKNFGNIFSEEDPFNSNAMTRLRQTVRKKGFPHETCKYCFTNW